MILKSLYLSVVIFLLYFCHPSKDENQLNGHWESIGYGKILRIQGAEYSHFDITQISCLPFEEGNIALLSNSLTMHDDTLSLWQGTGRYQYVRLNEIPAICKEPINQTIAKYPIYNFEVMMQTIKEHFAYFERNNINWDQLYNQSKAKITSNTNEVELYLVLDSVIEELMDNHGSISPSEDVYDQAELQKSKTSTNVSAEQLEEYGDFVIADMVSKTYLEKDLTKDSWLMNWGSTNEVGYIQIKAMWLYGDLRLSDSLIRENGLVDTYIDAMNNMYAGEYMELERLGVSNLMDRIMNDLRETEYMIIDVRFNGGGQDIVSSEILRRFNDERKVVATKKATNQAGITDEFPIYLEASNNAYTKPVYILTSPHSASATDFMTLASLELDHFVRIGSHSNGALSDALEKKLPNGWDFSLSNEIYEDLNGVCYESIGIPVDEELNYSEDRQTFFRYIASNLEIDKQHIIRAIEKLETE